MKIVSQTADQLVLQEGSTSGMMVGALLVIAGAVVWFLGHATNPNTIWISLAIVAVGIGVILFASSITVNASKASGQLLYQKKRLVGGSNATYSIADILRIETRKQYRMENNSGQSGSAPQPMLVAQSVILFKDGREVPLDHQKTSSTTSVGGAVLMSGQGKETAMAAQVASFLNVPFQEIAPPPFGGGLQINIGR
jgi:hypothetical protein